jgi:hypothetical protein
MRTPRFIESMLIGGAAVVFVGTRVIPSHDQDGPVLSAASSVVSAVPGSAIMKVVSKPAAGGGLDAEVQAAVDKMSSFVGTLSRSDALSDAFHSYFAFKTAHPDEVKKPYLYFVDYGQPSTSKRGYVFDMESLSVVEGPFTVAHGRGSSTSQFGVPTHFANASGSQSTSLGLYVTKALYDFHGHSAGHGYSSVGMRLDGVSTGFNDAAFARGVVAHGAPYVTPTRAGRSEGCPAMEPRRAAKLLPKLANGSLVFLYAPNAKWLAGDPWVTANAG